MRTINADLLIAQKTLQGAPTISCVIGTGTTVDVSAFVMDYDYSESVDTDQTILISLNNSAGTFNSLTGAYAPIVQGAPIEFKRGIGANTEELPRFWIEGIYYTYENSQALCVLECIDYWGKLEATDPTAVHTWTATSATTILEHILSHVGLTRKAGVMTATTIDFDWPLGQSAGSALRRLMDKLPEYLYPGLDGVINWKTIDPTEPSAYTFGWNAEHPVLNCDGGIAAWQINSVTVKGGSSGSKTGTASDAAQIAKVGTRSETLYDNRLSSNALCLQRATRLLQGYEAMATQAAIVCRPCHGLETLDMVTLDNPPWAGADVKGRVIEYRELWSHDSGQWQQVISLGAAPEKDYPLPPKKKKTAAKKKAAKKKKKTTPHPHEDDLHGEVMIGGIIMYSGAVAAIPIHWALCDGTLGTPNLKDRFVMGAGATYAVDATGGAATVDASHDHGVGTLDAAAEAAHTHADGSLAAEVGAHHHHQDNLVTASDSHTHNVAGDTANSGLDEIGATIAGGTDMQDEHHHAVDLNTDSDAHTHTITGGVGAIQGASAGNVSGATAAGSSHDHALSGSTATGGSATLAILNPWYALCFIMRID